MTTGAGQTAFTLPTNANVGDVIQISGAGGGGWTATGAAGIFAPQETVRLWNAVACSSDGIKLVAVNFGGRFTPPRIPA